MDWVARFGGGHNAGHTVFLGRQRYVLHLIPCGILQKQPRCIIGNGTVIDPDYLIQEMDALQSRGISMEGRLFISESAQVIMPYHRWLESLEGQDQRIGTTRRGIGPAYMDKVGRSGLRMFELAGAQLRARLEARVADVAGRFRGAGQPVPEPLDRAVEDWTRKYAAIGQRLAGYLADTTDLLHAALVRNERILCEGAQGTFLDVDHGTYPFVTSSSTVSGGASTGLGLPPAVLKTVVGVCKAYTTRVGEGPFPTELSGDEAESLRERGGEYGATTGRPRRVGWLDLVQLRQAVRLNGTTSLFLTKLDILTGIDPIRVCVGYDTPDGPLDRMVADADRVALCRPRYETLPGWSEPLEQVRRFESLPAQARSYIERVEAEAGCRVDMVSVGSGRGSVIRLPRRSRTATT